MNTNGHEEKRGTYAARVRISEARRTEARWLLPLLPKKEERAGERRLFFVNLPSLQLSPRSFLAGREGKKPSAFLCRTLGASRHVDLYPIKGEPFRIRTSIPPGWLQTQRIDVPPSRSAQRNTIRGVGEILLPVPPGQDARQAGRLPLQPKLFPILLT